MVWATAAAMLFISAGAVDGQTDATWDPTINGGNGVDYSDAANWDVNMVPVNNGTTYDVIIPGSEQVTVDLLTPGQQVVDLSMGSSSRLVFLPGTNLSAATASVDNAFFTLQTGSTAVIPATTYTTNVPGTVIDLAGAGTLLDMSAMTQWFMGNLGGTPHRTVSVSGGATLDVSGLTTITNSSSDDTLRFNATSGGGFDFSSLTTIDGPVSFDIEAASLTSLAALQSATDGLSITRTAASTTTLTNLLNSSGGTWNVPTGGSIDAPSLTQLRSTTINIGNGGALNAGNLVDVQGSRINLGPTQMLNTGTLFNIDDTTFDLTGGATLAVGAGSYRSNVAGTIIAVDGAGTSLDLSSVTSWTQDNFGGTQHRVVEVTSDGSLDLPNLQSITNNSGDDRIEFRINSGGSLDLGSLKTVQGPVFFNVDLPDFTLPMLETSNAGTWEVDDSATLNAPELVELTNTTITIGDGGELNTPMLTNVSGSTIHLGANQTLTHGGLGAIDNTRFFLTGGATLAPTDTTYVGNAAGTIMSADGAGTMLDLSDMTNWVQDNLGGTQNRTVTAGSGAAIDLSALQSITNNSGDDRLTFNARSSGSIDFSSLQTVTGPVTFNIDAQASMTFGDLTVTQNVTINVNDITSELDVLGSLLLNADAALNIAANGGLSVAEHYAYDGLSEAAVQTSNGFLAMDGAATFADPQVLEVMGEDLGLPTDLNDPNDLPGVDGNFAIGRLIVGRAGQSTVVELADAIDNGNRSSLEALYLPGFGNDGLEILGGSTLVLGAINVYAFLDGEWMLLNDMLDGVGVRPFSDFTDDPEADGFVAVPEPTACGLLAIGAAMLARRRRTED